MYMHAASACVYPITGTCVAVRKKSYTCLGVCGPGSSERGCVGGHDLLKTVLIGRWIPR